MNNGGIDKHIRTNRIVKVGEILIEAKKINGISFCKENIRQIINQSI